MDTIKKIIFTLLSILVLYPSVVKCNAPQEAPQARWEFIPRNSKTGAGPAWKDTTTGKIYNQARIDAELIRVAYPHLSVSYPPVSFRDIPLFPLPVFEIIDNACNKLEKALTIATVGLLVAAAGAFASGVSGALMYRYHRSQQIAKKAQAKKALKISGGIVAAGLITTTATLLYLFNT